MRPWARSTPTADPETAERPGEGVLFGKEVLSVSLGDGPRREEPAPGGAAPSREHVIGDGLTWTATWSLRWLLIVLGAYVAGNLIGRVWTILLPLLLALILTTILQPLMRRVQRALGCPASWAAGLVLLLGAALVAGLGFLLAPSVAGQASEIAEDASAGLRQMQDLLQSSPFVTREQFETVIEAAQSRLTESASSIASGVLVGVNAVTSAAITLIITVVLTFFFLKDGPLFLPWLRSVSGARAGQHLDVVLRDSWETLGGFIRTQALVSFIDAVFIGAALLLVGVPLAVPLAILTFVGGFVPIVGAFVVGAIAVLVALVSNGWSGALIILAVIVVVQQLEGNVLSPWLQSRTMKLHPVLVLLSVTLGSTLFGVVGAFFAVPVVAVSAVVLRHLNGVVTAQSSTPVEDP
ncbi:MAG: AI-2E family transporter [Nocardioides sp.]